MRGLLGRPPTGGEALLHPFPVQGDRLHYLGVRRARFRVVVVERYLLIAQDIGPQPFPAAKVGVELAQGYPHAPLGIGNLLPWSRIRKRVVVQLERRAGFTQGEVVGEVAVYGGPRHASLLRYGAP